MNQTKLKNYILFLSVVLFSLLNIFPIKADFYSISYYCEKNQCVSGEIIEWNITINNQGEKKIEIIAIELRDSINNSLIAYFNTTFNPLSDKKGDLFTIRTNQKRTKSISAKLPKANNLSNLVYYPCFVTAATDPYYAGDNIYSIKYCYDDRNEVMPVLECVSDFSCGYDEYCRINRCTKIKCESCQYISSHKCTDYECCNSNVCNEDEICKKNKCVGLNCSEDEYLSNHSCNSLNCSYDEAVINHSCVKLNCMFNETAVNHTCNALKCHFFQKIANHQCINDKPIIFKLSVELIVILVIITLLVIDIRKYESKRKEKQTEKKNTIIKKRTKFEENKKI